MARKHLIERIQEAVTAKLILVEAPAGFGKTTLLRHIYDVFSERGWATAWLTLDAGDNDLDRFMTSLGQAFLQMNRISSALPAVPAESESLSPDNRHSFELTHAIVSLPGPLMLILDEFEHLHNPALLSLIQQLTEMLGPQQKIVISSREQPALSIGRLRAHQQLLKINAAQLRFTADETDQFLHEKCGLKLDDQDAQKLHEITEGWPAALWLSSLALENNDDPKRFINTFSGTNTAIAAYLAEDVLSRKPAHLQNFILQTSILQKFCAESCNAVTQREDSRELLLEIERSNMFTTALDEQHSWFSYHPLFAEFLRAQLERQYPGLAPTLHHRASNWYIEQQRPVPAIDHAIASGDHDLVICMLNQYSEALFMQGRIRLIARWCDTLERSRLLASPKLTMLYAGALIHINRGTEALALLDAVANKDAGSAISQPVYLGLKALALLMLDRMEQMAPMWEDPDIFDNAAEEPLLRTMLMIACAYYYATVGRYTDARLLLDQATQEHPAVGPLFSLTAAGYVHGMIDLMQGHLRAAVMRLRSLVGNEPPLHPRGTGAHIRLVAGLRSEPGSPRYGADSGFASIYLAEALYETDLLDEAKRLLKLYLPLIKDAGVPDQLIASHIIYARILSAEGARNEALQTLLELEQLGRQRRLPRFIDMARLELARVSIFDGDLESAKAMLALIGNAPAWSQSGVQLIANDIENPTLAAIRLQVHSGQAGQTLPLLKEHLHNAQVNGRLRYALRIKVLYALALANAGQRNPALRTIRQALQEASQEGFVRPFKDEGPALLALVRDMIEGMKNTSDPQHAAQCLFAENLLTSSSRQTLVTGEPPARGAHMADNLGNGELTERELDVLRLLAQGFTNQTIAEKLFVSITTVKTHLRNINLKLGAHNRTEAISIARKRAIIS